MDPAPLVLRADKALSRKNSGGASFSGYERDLLALNLQDGNFQLISGISGLDSETDARGAVYADFDNDGDLDVFVRVANHDARDLMFRNNVGSDNHYLRVTLRGSESGTDAVGSVVSVKTNRRVLTRNKAGAVGFLSQGDPRVLFGLGQDERIEHLEVRWSSGAQQRFVGIEVDSSVLLTEGEEEPRRLRERSGELPDPISRRQRRWQEVALKPGQRLPAFQVRGPANGASPLDGVDLVAKEGFTLVSFWATWCDVCKRELPRLQRFHESWKDRGVSIIGISVDEDEPREKVTTFLAERGITYPVYLMMGRPPASLFPKELRLPLSLLVDGRGHVLDVFRGWDHEAEYLVEGRVRGAGGVGIGEVASAAMSR